MVLAALCATTDPPATPANFAPENHRVYTIVARHQTPSLIGLFVIFASFVIAIAWSDAATPRINVTNSCDSVIEPAAILPMGNIDLLGVTLYKQPKRCTQYRALQLIE